MFESLKKAWGTTKAFLADMFLPPAYDPARRNALTLGVVGAAKAATGGAAEMAANSGLEFKEYQAIIGHLNALSRMRGRYDNSCYNKPNFFTPHINEDALDKHTFIQTQKDDAKQFRESYVRTLEQLGEYSDRDYRIPVSSFDGARLDFLPGTVLTPEIVQEKLLSERLDDWESRAAKSAETQSHWARCHRIIKQQAAKHGGPVRDTVEREVREAIKDAVERRTKQGTSVLEALTHATKEQSRTIPEKAVQVKAKRDTYMALEKQKSFRKKYDLTSKENPALRVLPILSELFGGLEFRQRDDETLIFYASLDRDVSWSGAPDRQAEAAAAIHNMLTISGFKGDVPTTESLFLGGAQNKQQQRMHEVSAPMRRNMYLQLQPEQALALYEFYGHHKKHLENAKNNDLDLGDFSRAVETLQSMGKARNQSVAER